MYKILQKYRPKRYIFSLISFNFFATRYNVDRLNINKQYAYLNHSSTIAYKIFNNLPLLHILDRLPTIKRELPNIAFVGNNLEFLLNNLHTSIGVKRLFVCNSNKYILDKEMDMAEEWIKISGEKFSPFEIIPVELNSNSEWPFPEETLNCVIHNMLLHWENNLHSYLQNILKSLEKDCNFITSFIGENSFQQMRIALSLAQLERNGELGYIYIYIYIY